MIGILETCECGRKFLRGIYPQQKCHVCEMCINDRDKLGSAEIKPGVINNIWYWYDSTWGWGVA